MEDKPTLLISQSKRELFTSSNGLKQLQRRLRANWKIARCASSQAEAAESVGTRVGCRVDCGKGRAEGKREEKGERERKERERKRQREEEKRDFEFVFSSNTHTHTRSLFPLAFSSPAFEKRIAANEHISRCLPPLRFAKEQRARAAEC